MHKQYVSFFDAAIPGKTLVVASGTKLKLMVGDVEELAEVLGDGEKGPQHFELPGPIMKEHTDLHKACEKDKSLEVPLVMVKMASEYSQGCKRYSSPGVLFHPKHCLGDCGIIPIPLYAVPESCTIKLRAYDTSFADFIENSKSFLNNVQWIVKAVQTPAAAGSAVTFQPFGATVRSVEGFAEIPDVPPYQLYSIEARGPEGYLNAHPGAIQRYIGGEDSIEIRSSFRPCGKSPARSVIFVRQECAGVRWGENTVVNVGGIDRKIGKDGILHVPTDATGLASLFALGATFSPPYVDLRDGSNPVAVVKVSQQSLATPAQMVRGKFVDTAQTPFARRPLVVLLPNGDEVETFTDDAGEFEAPPGSKVFAREDDWGLATVPIVVSKINE